MRACFMSMAVTVLDFVFSLSFPVKWITSAVTRSVLFKVLYLVISMTFSKFALFCTFVRLMLIDWVSV